MQGRVLSARTFDSVRTSVKRDLEIDLQQAKETYKNSLHSWLPAPLCVRVRVRERVRVRVRVCARTHMYTFDNVTSRSSSQSPCLARKSPLSSSFMALGLT